MKSCKRRAWACCLGALSILVPTLVPAALAGERFVAGTAPQRRPAEAPVIKAFNAGAEWRQSALAGIGEPLPPSLKFLDHQGAWYTPFDRPGMPGNYDIRQLHAAPAGTKP